MFFIYNLTGPELVVLVVIVLSLCAGTYYFAVKSRKKYKCPECGEEFTGEYMTTSRCGMCGAVLNTIDKE